MNSRFFRQTRLFGFFWLFGLTIVSTVAYALPNFREYVTGFIRPGARGRRLSGWGTFNEIQAFRHYV